MKNLMLLCLLSLAFSCASQKPMPIIDAHIHTHFSEKPERTSQIEDSLPELLKEFKEAGVVGAVTHLDQKLKDERDLSIYNIIQCAALSKHANLATIEEGLKTKRFRCLKVYLGYVHEWAYSPIYRPFYKLAETYQVPVVFHTGDTYSTKAKLKYADPLTIDEVAVDFPKVKFVIAHCGNPWIDSAAEVAYKNPNVYLEVSAFLIGDLSKTDPEMIDELVVKPIRKIFIFVDDPNKMMFGTDWPLTSIKPYAEVVKKAIPEQHWRKVFYDNAASVFGFPTLGP